jgi:hypothetical protein
MNLLFILAKIKDFVKAYKGDIILFSIIFLLIILSFAVGFIVGRNQNKTPVVVSY